MDLFAKRNPEKERRSSQIKSRVVDLLQLDQEATVMVTELNCHDDECPEVETVIAVFRPGHQKLQVKLHSGIEEVADEEIERVCRGLGETPQSSQAPSAGSE